MVRVYRYFLLILSFLPLFISADRSEEVLPSYLNYVENKGQWPENVLYKTDFRGGSLFLENTCFTYFFLPAEGLSKFHHHSGEEGAVAKESEIINFHSVKMKFIGASSVHPIEQSDEQSFYYNFYQGSDKTKWASRAQLYKTVVYKEIYKGIDVKIFGQGNNVRYDLIVQANGNPSDIKFKFEGQERLFIRDGQLVILTSVGEIIQKAPYAYQEKDGVKQSVKCGYALNGNEVSFKISGNYNKDIPLIIDPTLVFATYTGSTSDNWGMSATYDKTGDAYTAGICFQTGYPVTSGAFQSTFGGGPGGVGFDISLSKFDKNGSTLIYSTYLGGNGNESPQSITVDHNNNLVILGRTNSSNYPVTGGAFSGVKKGLTDIVVTKLNSSGTGLAASTFVGGSADDGINYQENGRGSLKYNYADDGRGAIHVDQSNNVYVASCTKSSDFPVTGGAFQSSFGGIQDGCLFKMDPSLSSMIYCSFLGGSNYDAAYNLALNSKDEVYVTGGTESANFPSTSGALNTSYMGAIDGFITHVAVGGNTILESSFIGTSSYDQSYFVQIDKFDDIYLYGQTGGAYPVIGAAMNNNGGQFIHKLDPTLSATYFSTVFGTGKGTPDISPCAFLVDNCQNIYISGWGGVLFGQNVSSSTTNGLGVTTNAFQPTTDGSDFYFAVFYKNATGLAYATYFGGNISDEHVDGGTSTFDKAGVVYQAICESCGGNQDMPTTPGVWSSTNGSSNCNNALVKFTMDMRLTVAQLGINPFVTSGCTPFNVNFINNSLNAVKYTWQFGDGSSSTSVSPAHTYTTPGSYTVMLIASDSTTCNMIDTAYITLQVNSGTSSSFGASMSICRGDSAQLQNNLPANTSCTWTPTSNLNNPFITKPLAWPPVTTTYTVAISDTACNNTSIGTVLVNVKTNTIQIEKDPKNKCLDDTIRLSTTGPAISYSWSTGATGPAIGVTSVGIYSLTVLDNNGCKNTDTVSVSGFSYVPVSGADYSICQNTEVQLLAPEGNYTYQWSPSSSLSSDNIYNPAASPLYYTLYTLILSNGPCVSTTIFTVDVRPAPHLDASATNTFIIQGESTQLNVTSDSPFFWSSQFELTCTTCEQQLVAPEQNSVYYCTAISETGCSAKDSVKIEIMPTLYIPNSFSPNGDDINPIFKPEHTGYVKVVLYIFDRWGEQLFRTEELDGGWDGRYKGKPAELGVYVYKIFAEDYRGVLVEKVGSVTLLR